jgi:hypothetical protein
VGTIIKSKTAKFKKNFGIIEVPQTVIFPDHNSGLGMGSTVLSP